MQGKESSLDLATLRWARLAWRYDVLGEFPDLTEISATIHEAGLCLEYERQVADWLDRIARGRLRGRPSPRTDAARREAQRRWGARAAACAFRVRMLEADYALKGEYRPRDLAISEVAQELKLSDERLCDILRRDLKKASFIQRDLIPSLDEAKRLIEGGKKTAI